MNYTLCMNYVSMSFFCKSLYIIITSSKHNSTNVFEEPCDNTYQKDPYNLASLILNNNIFSTFLGVSFFHTRSNAATKQILYYIFSFCFDAVCPSCRFAEFTKYNCNFISIFQSVIYLSFVGEAFCKWNKETNVVIE
jgi:hypothetical protein